MPMERYIYMVLLIVLSITTTSAQRMVPGQKGVEITVGGLSMEEPTRNYYIHAAMTVNTRGGNYRIWALEYMHQYYTHQGTDIPHETYASEGGYNFFLLGDRGRNVTLNAALTGVVGYEAINRGEGTLEDGSLLLDEDGFVFGAGGRLTLETYLTDGLVLVLAGRCKALFGTTLEQFRPSAGFGLRFNF